jgi:hypothetical protein
MTTPASHEEERQAHAEFASRHAEEAYRWRPAELYAAWREINAEFFSGQLRIPHLALGRTAARSLGHCSATTDYGGTIQITLHADLVFGHNADWVVHPWPPARGTCRFILDLLLRQTVRQYALEVLGAKESGYRGFGPQFVAQANRVGAALGLGPVVERNRGTGDSWPVASGWPHCVRPAGYYGDDVTEAALELARGSPGRRRTARSAPSEGLLELVFHLMSVERFDDARRLVSRHLDWVRVSRESRWPPRRQVEAGFQDVDGSPLGDVTFSPDWLRWNGGTVRKIAEGVKQFRCYADLPILADALEEAGCSDGRILRHLRERMEHSRRCWVLRLLLALDAS